MTRWLLPALCAVAVCAAAGAAPPAPFSPVAFSATGVRDFWVLGRVPCRAGRCFSIRRTNDGGRTFARLPAPLLPAEGAEPELVFADRRDGFAYVREGALYTTHDGGRTWRRPPGLPGVLALAVARGTAYAVTARCSPLRCRHYRLARAAVAADAWTSAPTPFVPDGPVVDLAARGSSVWLLGTLAGTQRRPHDELARSTDGGRSFVNRRGPCFAGLGGALSPASEHVVWAVCPTGLLGGAWRSTDGGATFRPLRTPPLVNSARLAPASPTVAVLAGNGAGLRLLRTSDGGAAWVAARTPGRIAYISWLGFADARVGWALVQGTRGGLWRTTDGGARWSVVRLG